MLHMNARHCLILKIFGLGCPESYHVEISRLENGHVDLLIPNALLVGNKLHTINWIPTSLGEATIFSYVRRNDDGLLLDFLHSTHVQN